MKIQNFGPLSKVIFTFSILNLKIGVSGWLRKSAIFKILIIICVSMSFNIKPCAVIQRDKQLPFEIMAIILDFAISFKSEIDGLDVPFSSKEFLLFDLEINCVSVRRSARLFFNNDVEHVCRLLSISVKPLKDEFGISRNWPSPDVSVSKIEKALKKDRICRLLNIAFNDKRLKIFNIKQIKQ